MKKSHLLGAVCAVNLVALSSAATAEVVNPIIGLNIGKGGTLYDVTFHDGSDDSFNAIWDADDNGDFDGAAPTFWGDFAGAIEAANAIIARLGTTDTTTAGSDSFLVPYGAGQGCTTTITPGPATEYICTVYDQIPGAAEDSSFSSDSLLTDVSVAYTGSLPYATFTATVPIPAAAWLFASGLIGLIGIARRKVRV